MNKLKEQKFTERNKIFQSGRAELLEIHYPVAEETSSARPYAPLQHFHGMMAGSYPATYKISCM